jgi:hypothetical protein
MISQTERAYINDRYIPLVEQSERAAYRRSWEFHILVNFITIAGILITTFISLENSSRVPSSAQTGLYWTVVALGVLLIIANKTLYIFGIHKKYILTQQIVERYKTEGWLFLAGVSKYAEPSMDKRILIFCDRVERIQAKQTQDMTIINSAAASGIAASPEVIKYSQSSSDTPRDHRTIIPPQLRPSEKLRSVKVDRGKKPVSDGELTKVGFDLQHDS